MKLLLKLLLSLCVLVAGIYAATPLWLPVIAAGLLPTGWQLDELNAGYWGFSGIDINSLRVNGELQAAGIEVIAADIRFSYQGLKTDIGSLSLEAHLRAIDDRNADALTLDDLSLPVTVLTGEMPELSVRKLRVALHHEMHQVINNPLVLNFQSLNLTPRVDNSYHFVSDVSLEGSPGVNGRVDVDVDENAVKADIRFPASASSPSWLDVAFEQTLQTLNSTTHIRAAFDTAVADQEWLDSVLMESTGGRLAHVSGKLIATADFAGRELQAIEQLSLAAEQLQVEFKGGSVNFSAALLASREGQNISVTLPKPAEIQFQDTSGQINELIMNVVPGLQRAPQLITFARADIDASSSFVIQTRKTPSLTFSGDTKFETTSEQNSINLQATDLQITIEDLSRLDAFTANGLVTLDWVENTPFTYISDDLGLKADKLSLTSTGHIQFTDQSVDFKQADDFGLQLEGMQAKLQTGTAEAPAWLKLNSDHYGMQGRLNFDLPMSEPDAPVNFTFDGPVTATYPVINIPGDEHTPPMTITADDMSITAELISQNGALVSTGRGTFIDGQILPMATSAAKTDLSWQELDLIGMSGKFSTRTQGFATELEGETWTGFDFDITYSLLSNSGVNGSGAVMFDSGLEMPIIFAGNTQAEHWKVSLPASTIKLSQLGSLLRVAHFELPETVKLTDGYIDFQGDVVIDDEITAKMSVSGHEMGASMLESSAREASFTFDTTYGNTISAKGPVSTQHMATQSRQKARCQSKLWRWLAELMCHKFVLI